MKEIKLRGCWRWNCLSDRFFNQFPADGCIPIESGFEEFEEFCDVRLLACVKLLAALLKEFIFTLDAGVVEEEGDDEKVVGFLGDVEGWEIC